MKNNIFDPEKYTISIKKILDDGEEIYIASVAELPDIQEYADSADFARDMALDSITTAYEMFKENGMAFPLPIDTTETDNVSGRVTLRLPKSLHAKCIKAAESDGVSLNTYLTTCVVHYSAQNEMMNNINTQFTEVKHWIKAQSKPNFHTYRNANKTGSYWSSSWNSKLVSDGDLSERDSEIELSTKYSECFQ